MHGAGVQLGGISIGVSPGHFPDPPNCTVLFCNLRDLGFGFRNESPPFRSCVQKIPIAGLPLLPVWSYVLRLFTNDRGFQFTEVLRRTEG